MAEMEESRLDSFVAPHLPSGMCETFCCNHWLAVIPTTVWGLLLGLAAEGHLCGWPARGGGDEPGARYAAADAWRG